MILSEIKASEIADPETLLRLQKLYQQARLRLLYLLLIPALWVAIAAAAYLVHERWAMFVMVALFIGVLFAVGYWVFIKMPVPDEVAHRYAQTVLPGILQKFGVENPAVFRAHTLAVKTLAESQLLFVKFIAMMRQDCITGKMSGQHFGMYEISTQTGATYQGATMFTPNTHVRTNTFSGWFFVSASHRKTGSVIIISRKRITEDESDDWLEKTLAHYRSSQAFKEERTGNAEFDSLFAVFSGTVIQIPDQKVIDEFVFLSKTATNSFAVRFQNGFSYALAGRETHDLRKCPRHNFDAGTEPELLNNLSWHLNLISVMRKGFQ